MAERNWTKAQLSAIKYDGRNLLVSAAAGSGKTATLTERIIRLITDEATQADISRMLIVTFTKAAAAELRERVAAALGSASAKEPENKHLTEQLCRIGGAAICTMDSFFLSCVKPMFDQVGLPADFRIGDTAELDALRVDAMEETVEYFFDSADGREAAFSAVVEAIGSARTEEGLDDILLNFEAEADRVGIGETELYAYADELCRYTDADILLTPFGKCILEEILDGLRHFGNIAASLATVMAQDEHLKKSYAPAAFSMADYCEKCICSVEAGDTKHLRELLADVPAERINTKFPTEESLIFKEVRNEFKAFVKKMREGYLSDDPEVCADIMKKTAQVCRGAGEIIGEFRRRFSELKRRKGITDHSDVTRMAAMLLSDDEGHPTPYGETVASKYDYVFIDEYQDTSIYQDKIFAAVASKCGRFMVGDIKQSIYRFRGGEPTVFTGYREAWDDGTEGKTIFMSENFRCSEPVVRFVNAVSKYMFPYGHIPFEEGDLLVHGRQEPENSVPVPVEVCLIERPGNQRSSDAYVFEETDEAATGEDVIPPAAVIETEYVARRIRHMLDFESLPDGSPIRPSDIAIMLRETKSRKKLITDIFDIYGIPLNDTEQKPLLTQPEVMLLICILRAVDNPTRDIYLAGAMRSAVFGFSMGDIAEIRMIYDDADGNGCLWDAVKYLANAENNECSTLVEKCRAFRDSLYEFRTVSGTLSAAQFIYRLIHEPAVNGAIESEGGVGAIDRVMEFYEIARGRESGLYDFLGYLSHIEKSGLETTVSGGGDGVSVMTVHHSKGLEFPICFLMNATKKYNQNDSKKSMILDRNFGVAMKLPDEMGIVRCDNHLRRLAVFRSLRENSYEEMRILYVAMTRARERLIVTGVTNSPEKLLGAAHMNSKFYDRYTVGSKNNYMDIVLESLEHCGGDFANITVVPYSTADEIAVAEDGIAGQSGVSAEGEADTVADELTETLRHRIEFEYGYMHLQNIPSKLTVSRLYPEILDEFDDGADQLETEEMIEPSVPKFMAGTAYSPADAGSAAHVFMQFCDFVKLSDLGVGAELCRLVTEGFMSQAQGEAADLDYLEAFRKSEFFKRILSAKEVRREFRFNAAIPASEFTGDEEKRAALEKYGTDVIVQGVIDIVFTDADGRLVLADYKTDRLTDYELKNRSAAAEKLWERHGEQLRYYALVCEKLFGKTPDEVVIYSMPLGDTV